MSTDPSCGTLCNCYNMADAKLDYKLFCSNNICMYDIIYGNSKGLTLVPGSATDSSNLICCKTADEIILPECETYTTEQKTVQVENPCQTICTNCCDSCLIWTNTNKKASVSTAQIGDIITYTVEFTNLSAVALDCVQIFDTLPPGVTLIPDSIYPAPKPNETLQTGISVGSLPPCQTAVLRYSVSVDYAASCNIVNWACVRYCHLDCNNCCRFGLGSWKCSSVRIVSEKAGIKITKLADKTSVCSLCEEIVYTLKIANPCSAALTDVVVYDNIPKGLCYKTNSTLKDGCGPTTEDPQNGIYIGTLCPGQVSTVSFVLYVCSEPCCTQMPVAFYNTAYVYGNTCDDVIYAESNSWTVEMNRRCLCVQKSISNCDLKRFVLCYVHNTKTACYNTGRTKRVVAGYEICVKYIDCNGKIKSKSYEDKIVFNNLPDRFNLHSYSVKFKNLVCSLNCGGKLNTKFEVKLRYCLI